MVAKKIMHFYLKFYVCTCFRSQPTLDDSSGKSGAKFYQSFDKLFIIKTLTSEEVERMHSFLKHYHPVSRKFVPTSSHHYFP